MLLQAAGAPPRRSSLSRRACNLTAFACHGWSILQVAERAADEKKREQAGLQKERLLLEKKAKKKQADADKRVSWLVVQCVS